MAPEIAKALVGPAIKCASTAGGLALGGFLGGAAGGMVGAAFGRLVGEALGELGKKITESAIEKGSEFFIDKSTEPIIEAFRKARPTLEDIYREAFRLSLRNMRPDPRSTFLNLGKNSSRASAEYLGWFENWDEALKKGIPLHLEGLDLPQNELQGEACFKSMLERIDAQGAQLRGITLRGGERFSVENPSALPEPLLQFVKERLPDLFVEIYRDELLKEENRGAFNEKELLFQQRFVACFARLEKELNSVKEDTTEIRKEQGVQGEKLDAIIDMLRGRFDQGVAAGYVPESAIKEKDAIIAQKAAELEVLKERLSARAADPVEAKPKDAEISAALACGDLDEALRLQSARTWQARERHARELFTLGTIHELRFEWPQALSAFRQAWELGKEPAQGFKYAVLAQEINRFTEAISAYESVLRLYLEEEARARTLNNLAVLYFDTQRMQEAEETYSQALATYCKLAEADPYAYLPDVATTLNNLAQVCWKTQRFQKAEEAYAEALSIQRKLAEANPDAYLLHVAMTLNNLANLYGETQRTHRAMEANAEALFIRRKLAKADPDGYLPRLANTLNNHANLLLATQRMREAEEAFAEALAIRRKLAGPKPDAYLPDVATTLNNLAILYKDTQRTKEAEDAYVEALAIRRKLAESNPDTYLPDVATTLNNLAILWRDTHRTQHAEEAHAEALAIRRKLAESNPDAYLPYVAATLNNLANLLGATQRVQKAKDAYSEALAIRRRLAHVNPDAHLPGIANTLNNLAALYGGAQRMREAEEAWDEALSIQRKLAEANPDTYLPYVAITLNNLADLHLACERMEQAAAASAEAERILHSFWKANPTVHGNNLAKILWTRTLIQSESRQPSEACASARLALAAAYDPALKSSLQQLVERACAALSGASG